MQLAYFAIFILSFSSTIGRVVEHGFRINDKLNSSFKANQTISTPIYQSEAIAAPEGLKEYMKTGYRLLVGGGGANPYPRARSAMQLDLLSMWEPATQKILTDIQDGIRYVLETRNAWTMVLHGTGLTGMSTVLDNMIEPGDKVVVGVYGYWGGVASTIVERLGGNVTRLQKQLGSALSLQEIETALAQNSPKVLFLVNGESSTGVYQNLDGIGDLCHKYNCITVVDVIATVGQQPIKMDERKIDVVYMNSQKGLGGVVGLTPVSFSSRAVNRLKGRRIRSRMYQCDIVAQSKAWYIDRSENPHGNPLHSISLPLLYMLREGLAKIVDEGIENVWQRHSDANRYLHERMSALGIQFFVPRPEDRLTGTTTFVPPKGKDPLKIEKFIFDNYRMEITSGMGQTYGKVIRIGVFSNNADTRVVDRIINVMGEALNSTATNS